MKWLLIAFFVVSLGLSAREIPVLTGPVVDEANLLNSDVKQRLSSSLVNLKRETGHQLQLLIVSSLIDETIEGFSIKVVDRWKLGDAKKENGVLFLIAYKERRMRIEVGRGLEGNLPDALVGRIIDLVTPYFKRGDYNTGCVVGLSAVAASIGGDLKEVSFKKGVRSRSPGKGAGFILTLLIFLFLIGVGRRGAVGWFLLGSLTGSASRGGIFSGRGSSWGGGSWSGGGGGFSGGGASGGW